MAEGNKIVYTVETNSGDKTVSYANAKPTASVAQVKAVGAALIANTGLFSITITAIKAAKLVQTTEEQYDLS